MQAGFVSVERLIPIGPDRFSISSGTPDSQFIQRSKSGLQRCEPAPQLTLSLADEQPSLGDGQGAKRNLMRPSIDAIEVECDLA